MYKKILMCAIIALVVVPATVMAAGSGGQSNGAAGQGPCLQDGQNCMNQTGQQGTGTQEQFRHGMQQNGVKGNAGAQCTGDGQCTGEQKQHRSMLRLHDGSAGAGKNTP
jgi:hypothetical protein